MGLKCKPCDRMVRPKMTKLAKRAGSLALTIITAIIDPRSFSRVQGNMMAASHFDTEGDFICDGCGREYKAGDLLK